MRSAIVAMALPALIACSSRQPANEPARVEPVAAVGPASGAVAAARDIQGEDVIYAAGDTTLRGYLAWDAAATGPRPGILVVHEWWGHNDYARRRATLLAELGYVAFAIDMYGDGRQAAHPDDAKKFMMEVFANMAAARGRFVAAREVLQQHPNTDPHKIAAIGYCFGGGIVLNMARAGEELAAVASFHGSLASETPVAPGVIKGKIMVANGAADPFVTAEQIGAFRTEMQIAGVDLRFHDYPGAKHAFTNPDATALGAQFALPLEYNADADGRSWGALVAFLAEVFAD